jgi:hypothetical protein
MASDGRDLMRVAFFGALRLLAAVSSPPAFADTLPPATMPTPKVGDAVAYDARFATVPCKRWEVKDTNKEGSIILQCEDKLAYLSAATGNLTKIVSGDGETLVEFKPYSFSISFPLEVGKTWEGKYTGYTADNGYRWSGDNSCAVKGVEVVKVPAGQFEAYRIDCVDNWLLSPYSGQAHTSAWYAPKAGTIVKYRHAEMASWNYEVTSITMK